MIRIGIDATALPPQPVGAGHYIIQLTRALAASNPEDELVIFAQAHGRELIDLPADCPARWVIVPDQSPAQRLLWEQLTFPRLVRQARVDLLHSLHYTRPLILPCASVVTFHDLTFFLFPQLHTRSKRLFFPWMMRFSARAADALIADSESTRRDAMRILNIPAEKISTVLLGVTPDFHPITDPTPLAEVRARYHLPPEFILYVGLVEPRKNLPLLLRAYRMLVDGGIPHQLVIVGRFGWMVEEVLRLTDSLNLKDRVIFTGYTPRQDLPVLYNLASAFVYPTLYEGFGLPALEAMACGTPVVSSNVASLPEIVGDAGRLVPPGDAPALAETLGFLLQNPSLQQELKQKGPQRAAQFTWQRTAQLTRQVYQRALAAQ